MNQPHRAPSQFNQGAGDDQKIANMLALYQTPATIRDMKQTFFYSSVEANLTNLHFWQIFYNKIISATQQPPPPTPPIPVPEYDETSKFAYYAPLGTTRTLDISKYINDLLDIRVPKDKYFIELNLVECTIEADPSGWTQIPDRVFRNTNTGVFLEPTYNWSDNLVPVVPATTPPKQNESTTLIQTNKLSAPQTLYCRIRECSNGEPYNWAVTSSGQFSVDKSHQVVIRHSDINVSQLTLEFGHFTFTGEDSEYNKFLTDPTKQNSIYAQQNVIIGPKLGYEKNKTDRYVYQDYNQEYFNQVNTSVTPNDAYPSFYKGDYPLPSNALGPGNVGFYSDSDKNFTQLANRVPFYHQNAGVGVTDEYNLQGRPFFYNQQASKINFRFLVKIIHMF